MKYLNFFIIHVQKFIYLNLFAYIVPIIPEYLFELDHPNETAEFNSLIKVKNFSQLNNDLSSYIYYYHNQTISNDPDFTLQSAIMMSIYK